MDQERQGLYERIITWNYGDNSIDNTNWIQKWTNDDVIDGWDAGKPNCRFAHYTPNTGGWAKAIWSTTNQTIYRGDFNSGNYNWNNLYCYKPLGDTPVGGYYNELFASRGTASTFTYDVAKSGNYIAQAQADNGVVESWDNGISWNNRRTKQVDLTDAQAVDVATLPNGDKVAVTVGSIGCYGGICTEEWRPSYVFVKKIGSDIYSTENWKQVSNTSKVQQFYWNANEGRFREVAVSPVQKDRVFFGVNNDGIYWIDHIAEALDGNAENFAKIGGDGFWPRSIVPHPTNQNIIYVTNTNGGPGDKSTHGLWQGTKSGNNWSFTKLLSGYGNNADVSVWVHEGQTRIFYTAQTSSGENDPYVGRLKLGNAGWNTVITKNTNTVVNNNPYWENTVGGDFYYQNFGGVLGAENTILTNYYDHDMQLSHGIYKGAIQPNGTVNWTNWTGSNLYFGGATAMKLDGSGANRKLYMSTPGAGLLRRDFPVESGVGGGTNQAPVVNITSPLTMRILL